MSGIAWKSAILRLGELALLPKDMPALVTVRCGRHIGAIYEKLLARGKKPTVATVAVMRKLLPSIYRMLKHGQEFDGEKFYHMPHNAPLAA